MTLHQYRMAVLPNCCKVLCLVLLYICCCLAELQCCRLEQHNLNCTQCNFTEVPETWDNPTSNLVDLSHNHISDVTQFPYSPSIEVLILQHNNITSIATKAFVQLTNLKYIDLSFNLLTYASLSPLIFQGSDNIKDYEPIPVEILKLGHNVIHALDAKVFEHLPNLTELYLDHNPLTTLDSVTILAITNAQRNLRVLDLSYCGLTTIPDRFLHTLVKLTTLNLNGNQFTSIPCTLSEISGSLSRLSIDDNPLENFTFPALDLLEVLSLSHVNTMETLPSGALARLPALKTLYCNQNAELRYLEDGVFTEQQRITEASIQLELRNNALENLPEKLGVRWGELEVLDIRDNPWNCDCNLAWFTQSVVPTILAKHPDHIKDVR
ncbi:hypothetical protein B566_EDAN016602 [Ephemera danica]|nr:hypothetical protein B566_EDAN016602 [Ephemera danica]